MKEIWTGFSRIYDLFSPQALAYEVYTPYRAQGGSAWKAARVEGAVQFFGLDRDMIVLPFLPQDLKRGICGNVSASKQDVIDAISSKVPNLGPMIEELPKTIREHAADAAGHAYLAFEEIKQVRKMMGL